MKQTTALVGPRGWAALVLAGGAAFATPFLRSAPHDAKPNIADQSLQPDYSPTVWPTAATNLIPNSASDAGFDQEDWQELARLQAVAALPRPTADRLPSTAADRLAPKLPSWAEENRRVDQVVDQIRSSSPLESTPADVPHIQPQRPWVETSEHFIHSDSAPSLANSLSLPKSNDPADPFGRWSSPVQESQAHASVSNSKSSSHATSNSTVKPFEDKPKLWPDQKVPISELAEIARPGVSAIVQAPAAQGDFSPAGHATLVQQPALRSVAPIAQPANGQLASQSQVAPAPYPPSLSSHFPSAHSVGEPARFGEVPGAESPFVAQASSVAEHSQPRVDLSSASRRAPMGAPNPPALPASPLKTSQPPALPQAAPDRPRQFIFQPAKKA